ncbi:hypothetical protein DEJ36_17930 [Curtobacterium sp. MCPF17_052]|nr:hypothetical protein [Curtobacterium sp. MCPF17_052]WIB12487.1 hypothetical protein DEJ36_17930 [Curtobacterium sp. MCPF17_052]
MHPTRALWAIADRTEAAVHGGRPETVTEDLAEAEAVASGFHSAHLTSLVLRSRALLAPADEAEHYWSRAIEAGQLSESPIELARTRLLFGEWLRRERRVVEAREHLRDALGEFDAAGTPRLRRPRRRRTPRRRRGPTPRHHRAPDDEQPADAAGTADRPARRRRHVEPRDRGPHLPLAPHRQHPPLQAVPEARGDEPHRTHRSARRERLRRLTVRRRGTGPPTRPRASRQRLGGPRRPGGTGLRHATDAPAAGRLGRSS